MKSLMAIGSGKEAAFYANLFAAQDPEKFALISIDTRCLQNPLLEALTSDLKIISDLGLTPILVVGALDESRVNVRFQAQRLSKALEGAGIKNSKLNCASYQLMPDVLKKIRAGNFNVLEMTERHHGLNFVDLAKALQPAKIISLQPSGGFRKDGVRVATANIDQLDTHVDLKQLTTGQTRFIEAVRELAAQVEHPCTYVVVSPLNLLGELFTVRGTGTMLRRGARIISKRSYGRIARAKLRSSIERAFDRSLAKDYFERSIIHLSLEENFRGGAIVSNLAGVPYLSKFWVAEEAQGEGIAGDIWQDLEQNVPAFFWRSQKSNPFNNWYIKVCDGMQISGEWRVFWKGLNAPEIPSAILAAASAPHDFDHNKNNQD